MGVSIFPFSDMWPHDARLPLICVYDGGGNASDTIDPFCLKS